MITLNFKDLDEMMCFAKRLTGAAPDVSKAPETTVNAPGLTAAPTSTVPIPAAVTPPAAVPVAPAPTPSVAIPVAPPTAAVQTAPAPATVQPSVPTTAQSYTLDDLAQAAMTLMDAGRQPDLLQLLSNFGVESLPALPPAQYGAFATALRGLGAQI